LRLKRFSTFTAGKMRPLSLASSRQLKSFYSGLRVLPGFFVCLGIFFVAGWPEERIGAGEIQKNASSPEEGQADFSRSEMLGQVEKIREGDTMDYEIILRNTGSRRPAYVQLANPLSSNAVMLVWASPELAYNADSRILHWQGNVDPGKERRFTVRLITLPGSYCNLVINHADIAWNGGDKHLQIETKVVLPAEVSREQFLFIAGGIGFTWLEIMIVGYLLFIPLFLIAVPRLIRGREKQRFEASPTVSRHDKDPGRTTFKAMSIALLLSLAFMPFLMSTVIDDIRRFVSYEKTTCTILDKKAGWLPGSRGSYPIVAVRYDAGGKEIISAGPLAKGGSTRGTSSEKRIAPYEVGKSYPCWFDPDDLRKFVLKREDIDWRSYLLFLLPLILALISFRYFLKILRRPPITREG
jgi:hypothetical protein